VWASLSISWELLADAAVLPVIPKGPHFRFTPQAPRRRSEKAASVTTQPQAANCCAMHPAASVSSGGE
jgi:hypothetical protein